MAAMDQVAQVCREQGADDETAKEIADAVVEEARCELAASGASDEDIEKDVISHALYDLTAAEVTVLQNMEDEMIEEQCSLAQAAEEAETPAEAESALEQIDSLEQFIENIIVA